jgi:hypothetical protein
MTTFSPLPAGTWVAAAPFRAHVRHLLEATGLPWRVVAVHADAPERMVASLLFGRGDRPLRRIPPDVARRLLSVRISALAALATQSVPVTLARSALTLLRQSGASLSAISHDVGVDAGDLTRILAPNTRFTTRRIELLLACAAVERGVAAWSDDGERLISPWPVGRVA